MKKISILPVKVQFEDDSFELTTVAINSSKKTLTCTLKNFDRNGPDFKVLGVDEDGKFFELSCHAHIVKGSRVTAKWEQ